MEASLRICNRHVSNSLLLKNPSIKSKPHFRTQIQAHVLRPRTTISFSSASFPRPTPTQSFPSLSLNNHSSAQFPIRPFFSVSQRTHFSICSFSKDNEFLEWNFASKGVTVDDENNEGIPIWQQQKGPEVTVVLLGWLGGKRKHLKRYVEFYNSKGIHAVTFVASVQDVLLSFDLGRKVEERIAVVALQLASWLSESEKNGRQRFLLFHTFSNTGWLTYGTILSNLQDRQDVLESIKGCIVDSGGDPHIDPKVWAAGFTAALLKKNSSFIHPSVKAGEGNKSQGEVGGTKLAQDDPFLIETLMCSGFEKLFSFILNLPNVKQRLTKIIHSLTKNQPPGPQLYLYSTADKVIPYQSVELFIEEQRKMGKRVFSYNFVSSPHVDHYRTFPNTYIAQLNNFLKECLVAEEKLLSNSHVQI